MESDLMKKINFIMAILFMLSCIASVVSAQSVAVIDNPVYNFGKVTAGMPVSHDFIIKNQGDSTLHIINIKPPWGCDKHSFDEKISPGGEGKVSVTIKTYRPGGRKIAKVTTVRTDDPNKAEFRLIITGKVEKKILVNPQ
jgi:hypothetical protein